MIEKINENGLRSHVRDRILRLMKESFFEETEEQPIGQEQPQEGEQQGLGYSIDTFISDKELKGYENMVIPAYTNRLTELKEMCDRHGIDFEWSITRVESPTGDKKESGWKISANAAMPDLKVAGYTYVGSVVPMTSTYALVAPSKEFKDNLEVLDKIKTTVAKEKCAGCNRAAERGIYYVFREDATGDLKKFGSTCAKKYLGISVDIAINKVFSLLYNEMRKDEFSFGYDDDGFFFGGRRGDWRPRGYDEVAAACAYFAIFGIPEARFSFRYCKEYDELVRYFQCIDRRDKYIPSFIQEIDRNYTKINKYISSFYSGVYNFSDQLQPQNDFEDSIKGTGLYLGGVHLTKAGERRIRSGIFPYVALKYFQTKRDEGIEVTAVEEFYGTKEFMATILNKVEKRRIEGNGVYLQIYAKTDNNEYLAWYQNQDMPDLVIGKQVKLYGEYGGENGKYCMLTRVRVMGQAQLDQMAQRAAIAYQEDGFRYRNATFTVVRSTANYEILKDPNGCEYFVSNTRKDRWGEVVGLVIQDWAQIFKVGGTVRLTGTVGSYVDRYGETKHTLKRVAFDETSFPEIDYSQIPMDELIFDRHIILINGKPVKVTDARNGIENLCIVTLQDDTYAIYNPDEQRIIYQTDDWNAIRTNLRVMPYLQNWELMKEKGKVIEKNRYGDGGYVVFDNQVWFESAGSQSPLSPYTVKGDYHLILDCNSGKIEWYYYNVKSYTSVPVQFTGDNIASEENINNLKMAYEKLPVSAPAVAGVNENFISYIVTEAIKRAISMLR